MPDYAHADPRPADEADFRAAASHAASFRATLASRPIQSTASATELRRLLDRPLPEVGWSADQIIRELVADVAPGLIATGHPRFFGFVASGVTAASLQADWLTSVWDQNAQVYSLSPAAAVVEEIVSRWVLELLNLPRSSSVGFVTGGQMANFTALAVGRNTVLERAGWDVDGKGLIGAPPVTVFVSECAHGTVLSALRMLGLGTAQIHRVAADAQGRMDLAALARGLRENAGRPLLLSLQAGNVNSGAFEPFAAIADLVRTENAWIHVDGAFGLWAAVTPGLADLTRGMERADSWSTDGHKWLNIPCDSGLVIVRDPSAHRRLKLARCAYAGEEAADHRDGSTWGPENSRRARAFVLYAVLREFGRKGLCDLVERCCRLARQFAAGVERIPGGCVLNDIDLSQVLFAFPSDAGADPDEHHRAIATRLQAGGACWIGTTRWQGRVALRVSITNAFTREPDIETALAALGAASRARPFPA
jgi:glutamate/tyrosine decarboxylase-like PLP-dependent enzyme